MVIYELMEPRPRLIDIETERSIDPSKNMMPYLYLYLSIYIDQYAILKNIREGLIWYMYVCMYICMYVCMYGCFVEVEVLWRIYGLKKRVCMCLHQINIDIPPRVGMRPLQEKSLE